MFNQSIEYLLQFALIVMVTVPLATIVLGELIDRLRRTENHFLLFANTLRTVVMPIVVMVGLCKYLFGLHVVPDVTAHPWLYLILYPVALSALYVSVALAAFRFITAVKAEDNPEAWQNRIPSLFKALFTALVFVVPIFLLLDAWGIEVGDFAKIVGVAGIALGFALQDALSSITKGVLLVMDKPFAVGDWIEVNGVRGRVLDISWRSTRLQVKGCDVVVIPNLIISDNSVYNLTALDIAYWDSLTFGFSYDDSPTTVKRILHEVIADCEDISKDPAPKIMTVSYDDFSIGYKIHYHVAEYISPLSQAAVRDDVMSRIWYAAKRGGISIPFPIVVEGPPRVFEPDYKAIEESLFVFLSENRYFSCLDEQTLQQLSELAEIEPFSANETVFEQGQIASSVSVVYDGEISLSRFDAVDNLGNRVYPHDIVNEVALMGKRANQSSATAITDTRLISFKPADLKPVLEKSPQFARMINVLIETRLLTISDNVRPLAVGGQRLAAR